MRSHFGFRLALLSIVLAAGAALPAAADLTVTTHYNLVNGDTLTRASYYTSKRVRVTAPDGREYMFNAKGDSVTVIDHKTRMYWTGPRSQADTVANRLIAENRKEIAEIAAADPVAWGDKVKAFNDSIKVFSTYKTRKIAGYPCDQWMLTAGSYLTDDRWIARSLSTANYGPEMQKVVMASIKDPLGRQLMRMMIETRTKAGLPLAGSVTFQTMSREGSFSYEAVSVNTKPIPMSAWAIPEGYTQITL